VSGPLESLAPCYAMDWFLHLNSLFRLLKPNINILGFDH
jgi:hypothetical protein